MTDDLIAQIEAKRDPLSKYPTHNSYRNGWNAALDAVLAILRAEPSRSSPDPTAEVFTADDGQLAFRASRSSPDPDTTTRIAAAMATLIPTNVWSDDQRRRYAEKLVIASRLGSSPDLTGLDPD